MKVRCPKRDCSFSECKHYNWHKDTYKCNHVIWCCLASGEKKKESEFNVICISKRGKVTRKKEKEPRQPDPPKWLTWEEYWKLQGYTSHNDYWEKAGVFSKQGIFGRLPKKRD